MLRDNSLKPFRNQKRIVVGVEENPLFLTNTRFSYPLWITKGYNENESKLYLFNLIGNPSAGWNEVKVIDVATNKLSTLTNSITGMLYMDGGGSWRNANEFLITGRDWNGANISNSSPTKRVFWNGSTWVCDTTDVEATWSHPAATYDTWCIYHLKHSRYNINGKQAYLTGQYENTDTSWENGLRLHYWTGSAWTNLNLRTKMPQRIDGIGTTTSIANNGQTPFDIWEDANGKLYIICGVFTASGHSGLFILEPNTTGTGLTSLTGWNSVIKLCGRTNSLGGGFANGTGDSALFRQNMRFVGVDSYNGNGNPIFIVCDRGNHCIRRIDTGNCTNGSGIVTTLAGTGGSSGSSDGIGTGASFNQPFNGVLITVNGIKYAIITDYVNHKLRKINMSTLEVSTYGGDGVAGNLNN